MAHYKVICRLDYLSEIRNFVRSQMEDLHIRGELAELIVVAVDEACANSIIHHHKSDGVSEFDIYIEKSAGSLLIEIRDEGKPFPIDEYKPKGITKLIKRGSPGGLGIQLIMSIMDRVEVIEDEGHFCYRFIKNL